MSDLRDLMRQEGLDSVAGAFACDGVDLDKPNLGERRRTRLELRDHDGRAHVLFLKRYGRCGAGQMLRALWTHGRFRGAAMIEHDNILAARQAGATEIEVLAAGQEPACCGRRRSYLVMSAVAGEALERCDIAFWARLSEGAAAADFVGELAGLVSRLHGAGYVHRDLYTSHVFVDARGGRLSLGLIDLARAFRPRWRRFRWRVKDLAQLRYSLPETWASQHWDAVLREYLGPRAADAPRWHKAIDAKVARMRRKAAKRSAE